MSDYSPATRAHCPDCGELYSTDDGPSCECGQPQAQGASDELMRVLFDVGRTWTDYPFERKVCK